MKISSKVQKKISNRKAKAAIMSTLGFSEVWVSKLIKDNKPNGPLTTISAINTIKQLTGLSEDEILTQ